MIKYFQLTRLLSLSVFLCAPSVFAQDDEPVTEPVPETRTEKPVPAGQEVEINEDNYRQFMELRDTRQQRNGLPENAYRSQTGMQKIEKLPEDSQKHLRNQLREIIIKGDQWQPGDEGTEYPYTPSDAAKTDQALQKLEQEAWGELVGDYHEREAEIYANSARSEAATANASAPGGKSASKQDSTGSRQGSPGGSAGQAGENQQSSQQSISGQNSSADSYSPDAVNNPNAKSMEGVSQNALEYLMGEETPTDRSANDEPETGESVFDTNPLPELPSLREPVPENSAQQIHLELDTFQPASSPPANADSGDSEGTLTIEELINAQGVGGAAGTAPLPGNTGNEEEPVEKPPAEDGE